MQLFSRFLFLSVCLALPAAAQTSYVPSVGSGAPTAQISYDFQLAFYRGNFQSLVSLPPIADVRALGSTGLVQEFNSVTKAANVKLALVLPNKAISGYANDIYQLGSDVYGYYSTVGAATAGYPTMDSAACPGLTTCSYDIFTNNYALFVFNSGNPNGTNFAVSGNYYTKWTALGGIGGPLGLVYTDAATVTSSSATTGGGQSFNGGGIYTITSGVNNGGTFAVLGSIYTLYQSLGGPTGQLGFPTADQVQASTGVITQSFETGKIQYVAGGTPVLLLPVSQIQLSQTTPVSLSYGQTFTVTESAFDANGNPATNRLVSWSTSNGKVVTVTAANNVAVLHAVGGGTASVTATSEGKISAALLVSVTAPCCQVGDGAPLTIQQAFQSAVARDGLAVQIPGPSPAKRVSTGYTQDLLSDRRDHALPGRRIRFERGRLHRFRFAPRRL